ncbi:MAG: response regulator transcription factor [Acidiferrobacteraceae bacterium]
MNLLLVEDDVALGGGVKAGLTLEDCDVHWVQDGHSAEQLLSHRSFDVLVLDLGLPRRSGMEVLRSMRERGDATPVLILTARDAVGDRVQGLDAGGDDYLVKPFDLDELSARIRALYRRHHGYRPDSLRHGGITVDRASQVVSRDGESVHLSRHEYALLCRLLEQRGRVLPRGELESALYGSNVDVESNTIEVHIHALRKKLGSDLIRTVRGVGYIIDDPR